MCANRNLAGMILLITHQGEQNRTALNKLLFFSDLVSYFKYQKTISEDEYLKLDFGPVPHSVDDVRTWLVSSEMMTEELNKYAAYRTYLYNPTEKVNFQAVQNHFGEHQVEIINSVVSRLGRETATTLSAITHEFEPWLSADWAESLDFERAIDDDRLKKWLQDKSLLTRDDPVN
ncbi:MAG: SocA family protein [Magnetococcales bacterium]|nr:SocA family protein [Magnetococcales bacterium]